jgi:hypothetical protein
MPLRPVSELGLVDVTDRASREDDTTTTPGPTTRERTSSASPAGGATRDASARKGPKSPGTGSRSRETQTDLRHGSQDTTTGSLITDTAGSLITDTGIPVLSGAAIGVAGALLLGRTLFKR